MSEVSERIKNLTPNKKWLLTLKDLEARLNALESAQKEPIAIVGMGCRFPDGVNDPESYWDFLRDGRDAIKEVPASRWDIHAFYDPDPTVPGKMTTRWAGFLDSIEEFDASFFGIAPREAVSMDPQQRLLLEVAWEALEHANIPPNTLVGSRTGVFIGISSSDYSRLQTHAEVPIDAYQGTGQAFCVAAGRISYVLGLQGPAIALDTACSSSLVAAHLACQSLRSGECTLALVGGVNLLLAPESFIYYSQLQALASDGHCKTFDAAADGYGRGEGAGVVVLKRLSDAVAAGDTIFALIRGSAVNQDGHSNGLTAPNGLAQQAVIRQALAQAEVEPIQVGYVETHGTGTILGDPIEVQALGATLCQGVAAKRSLTLGAVKTNIGHLEAAAGIAGLIKAVQVLRYGEFPPLLHLQQLNPHIPWNEFPINIPTTCTPWTRGENPHFAGISAFGFSGTNAHLILQEPPLQSGVEPQTAEPAGYLLPLSAPNSPALRALASTYAQFLAQAAEKGMPLHNICYTASIGRNHDECRLAVVGQGYADLIERLQTFSAPEAQTDLLTKDRVTGQRHKLAFIFPGQGGQWLGMGRQLLATEKVFRQAIEECEQAMRPYIQWSLHDQLLADEETSGINEIDVVQPLLFAIQVGLARLWRSWGIEPEAVAGHSMGEIAAAHSAGILSLQDAACVICQRSILLRRLSGQGSMVMVELTLDAAQQVIANYRQQVAIAVSNGPRSTVLAGERPALEEIINALEQQQVFYRWIKVDVASHSPQVDALQDELARVLYNLQPQTGNIPIFSTVTGQVYAGQELDAAYWIRNVRQPVRFWDTVQQLIKEGYTQFIEISPHPTLLHAIDEGVQFLGADAVTLPSLRHNQKEQATLQESLAALYIQGRSIHWKAVYSTSEFQRVALPPYPWQHERFWFEVPRAEKITTAAYLPQPGEHPLLGKGILSATQQGTYLWEKVLRLDTVPYLRAHRVGEAIVMPAAAYVEMMQAASLNISGTRYPTLSEITFDKMLLLDDNDEQPGTIQVVLSQSHVDRALLQIFSRAGSQLEQTVSWTLHASGSVMLHNAESAPQESTSVFDMTAIQQRCSHMTNRNHLYTTMQAHGVQYGPAFQRIQEYWRGTKEALAHITLNDEIRKEQASYQLHPILLDAVFQTFGIVLTAEESDTMCLPVGIAQLQTDNLPWSTEVYHDLWAYAQLHDETATQDGQIQGDVFLLRGTGEVLLAAWGLRCQILERPVEQSHKEEYMEWLYTLNWQESPHNAPPTPSPSREKQKPGQWLIFADTQGIGEHIKRFLADQAEHCVVVQQGADYQRLDEDYYCINPTGPDSFLRLLKNSLPTSSSYRGIVYLWGLDSKAADELTSNADLQQTQAANSTSILYLVQALAQIGWRDMPRLWLITSGVHKIGQTDTVAGMVQSTVWGLGSVIRYEHADLSCSCIDLSHKPGEAEQEALFHELWIDGREEQIALRGLQRYVARLVHGSVPEETENGKPYKQGLILADKTPYRLYIEQPGIMDTAVLRETQRGEPGADEVEIQVYAAGLNFLDVLAAMGIRPDVPGGSNAAFGIECAGVITRVGEHVQNIQVGQEIVAIAPGCLGSYAVTPAALVAPKAIQLSFEEAASLPIAFLTAYYALVHMGHLSKGERVLIHSAAGGVGLAAVQIAQRIGAEIFATAGNPEKRSYLHSLGIKQVMDSRSLTFADEILAATGGQGVDVVLNALTGKAISKSLEILAPYGRFLEIGKKDIYQHEQMNLWPFHKNLSYCAIDLALMFRERTAFCSQMFRELMAHFASGTMQPLPRRDFSITDAKDALRYMAQAKHIGKIILMLHGQEAWIEASTTEQQSTGIHAEATYCITGGLGALGLLLAGWLARHGARHLVLSSRHEAGEEAQRMIQQIERLGTQVRVLPTDISRQEQVKWLIQEISATMPPLKGVFHIAGVLDDAILLRQNKQRFETVLAPKVSGSWNLHSATKHLHLEHFVLFSSAASLLGAPGQGNYAAANAFMDALAQYRKAQGLAGLSINWGAWARVGLAAAQANRGERAESRGMRNMEPEKGLALLEFLLLQQRFDAAQVGVFSLDVRQWCQYYPMFTETPLFSQLVLESQQDRAPGKQRGSMRLTLEAIEPARRKGMLEEHVCQQIAQVLRLDPTRLERQSVLERLGFDSLMALELRNRLELSLELRLPATLIWAYPTTAALVDHLADQMGLALDEGELPEETIEDEGNADTFTSVLSNIADLTDSDLEDALSIEINKLSDTALPADWIVQLDDAE